MTVSADSSAPTKVLSHFCDHTFVIVFSFMFFSFIIDIVGKGIPGLSLFLRQTPLDPDCPPF